MNRGFLYILNNPSLPEGFLKIGMTTRNPNQRAKELSTTSVAAAFQVAHSIKVIDCKKAEKVLHERLFEYRVNKKREFFKLPLQDAIAYVNETAYNIDLEYFPRLNAPFLFYDKVSDVKKMAWEFYSNWRQKGSTSPKFGKVDISLKGWRHITRVSNSQKSIIHKLNLLPCAKQLLETSKFSNFLRKSEYYLPGKELHCIWGLYETKYQPDIIVEVVLEITKYNMNNRKVVFYGVCEKKEKSIRGV